MQLCMYRATSIMAVPHLIKRVNTKLEGSQQRTNLLVQAPIENKVHEEMFP